ncbi:stage VI sporulation protein F [Caldifermentibacillus hisashii]|uniref:stage VI sporulation protein F n=1 Tax=Caldifermentibacillus hisashii TaxID=996558 RepID=UPI001C102486|nr:stage VI sporulation protein F [Caldifermentibacillus hisashii]MBU5342457.1 stage VI sporulation protein F [Caldifermentibacillus hisashii]
MENNFFKNIEKKTGVNMNDIFQLANSIQGANLQDETTVRQVVKQVSKIAGRNIPKEMEDKIVRTIIQDGKKLDFNTIANMMNNKK